MLKSELWLKDSIAFVPLMKVNEADNLQSSEVI